MRTYNLGAAGPSAVQAIVEVLQLDRDNVVRVEHDAATGSLLVELVRPETAERIDAVVRSMLRMHRRISPKVVREHRVAGVEIQAIDEELAASPHLLCLGAGLCGLAGPLLALLRWFEARFRSLAASFGAEEHHYPVLVLAEILEEVGYFTHFPQHVTFCCHLPDSLPVLESVAADARQAKGSFTETFADRLCPPRHVLTPGVCLPCYRQQRDVVLGPGEVRTLTMQNHVFRYEGATFRPLTRAWDFSVRDIVFFGSYEQLHDLREQVVDACIALCRELELDVRVELANDPFFLDANRDKAIYQRMGEVKYELLFDLPHRGQPLAAASFNLHRDFYTKVYGTRRSDGQLAESACVGFGLERWVYGFLSQKGLDPRRWPALVQGSSKPSGQ
ncbi:hypothetical protein WME90_21280 [Sorangium sp. So ce375]|uniref:hypothetical protein n=1 Tax=Sorangium sp. So ce375 TaxID=3133306 RepID=UPI003F5C30F5